MNFTALLLTLACLQVSAAGLAQITLSEKNAPLEKVLQKIKAQSGLSVVYQDQLLQKAKPVDIVVSNATVEQTLTLIFKNQPLSYEIIAGKIISVKEKDESPKNAEAAPAAPPAPIDISGKITDKDGNPLNGASVKVKGTNKGTTTAVDGVFVLKGVEGNATLEISFIGYETTTVGVNNRTSIIASLNVATQSLQDVVVSKGYYSTTKRLNTGDVTTVSGDDIRKQPVTDFILALEGRVAGLNIQQASGVPGAYGAIRIRGQSSIGNGNDPLYIVDGVPYGSASLTSTFLGSGALGRASSLVSNGTGNAVSDGGNTVFSHNGGGGMSPFNSINPSDIESVEVLKDADATAIYGSRGANGVILITTKKRQDRKDPG